ncbi:MAG: pyruvate ferredoxin oxidoreductase, partial [Deltaproteobacteria bacterium]|nr:pyruvate ferredoxin oxidoreductase [Deltaproteobacteria bacterium]
MKKMEIFEGSMAVALAVKACKPGVISAYPISPQTHIVEALAKMVANGELNAQYVLSDSEFSAASIVYGASAAGVRSYTASSSQGLLLMTEVIYNAAGTRLPLVLTGVNRAISAPISIQVDHQDTLSLRDSGLIQFYAESVQEAYDMHIQAFRIAEDPDILLPVMICMDGWVLTHSYEPVELIDQKAIDTFLPPYRPLHYLNPEHPLTFGSYAEDDVLMELKYMIQGAMEKAKGKIGNISSDFLRITGHPGAGLIETYQTEQADIILVGMGSMVGTMKEAVDAMRADGLSVGLVKISCYRPFPAEAILESCQDMQAVAVLDRGFSMGSEGPLSLDVKAALSNLEKPHIFSFIAGL